jgi:hypothetical protein
VDKTYVHLTNYSVNKKNEEFVKPGGGGDADEEENASKWNLF